MASFTLWVLDTKSYKFLVNDRGQVDPVGYGCKKLEHKDSKPGQTA